MTKKLDKSRPYGTIHGSSSGQCFMQDDTIFDAHGNPWVDPSTVPAGAKADVVTTKPMKVQPNRGPMPTTTTTKVGRGKSKEELEAEAAQDEVSKQLGA